MSHKNTMHPLVRAAASLNNSSEEGTRHLLVTATRSLQRQEKDFLKGLGQYPSQYCIGSDLPRKNEATEIFERNATWRLERTLDDARHRILVIRSNGTMRTSDLLLLISLTGARLLEIGQRSLRSKRPRGTHVQQIMSMCQHREALFPGWQVQVWLHERKPVMSGGSVIRRTQSGSSMRNETGRDENNGLSQHHDGSYKLWRQVFRSENCKKGTSGHLWAPKQGRVELWAQLWQSQRWRVPDGPQMGQKIFGSLHWGYQGWAQCSDEEELRSMCERFENILGVIWMSEDQIDWLMEERMKQQWLLFRSVGPIRDLIP